MWSRRIAIELFNPTDEPASIGGWFLSDRSSEPKKFRIPNPAIIPPGGYALFTAAQFNPVPGVYPSFSLSS